jgi:hypothetical protein
VPTLSAAGRHDLADDEWRVLEPLLPAGKRPGRPPKHPRRQLLDAIRWRVRAGSPWRDVPPAYGPWQSAYGLFRRWQRDGTGARKNGGAQREPPGGTGAAEPADHALGRSRGGLTTKFHLAVEQGQKPLALIVTAGQRGDSPQFTVVLDAVSVSRPGGRPGPARTGSWPTRPTGRARTALTCGAAGSRPRSPSSPTASATARTRAARAAGRPRSTRKPTSSATPSSAASTASSGTGPSLPGTTN